jgi:hypothetical protein
MSESYRIDGITPCENAKSNSEMNSLASSKVRNRLGAYIAGQIEPPAQTFLTLVSWIYPLLKRPQLLINAVIRLTRT